MAQDLGNTVQTHTPCPWKYKTFSMREAKQKHLSFVGNGIIYGVEGFPVGSIELVEN